jgi:hypothetical protein
VWVEFSYGATQPNPGTVRQPTAQDVKVEISAPGCEQPFVEVVCVKERVLSEIVSRYFRCVFLVFNQKDSLSLSVGVHHAICSLRLLAFVMKIPLSVLRVSRSRRNQPKKRKKPCGVIAARLTMFALTAPIGPKLGSLRRRPATHVAIRDKPAHRIYVAFWDNAHNGTGEMQYIQHRHFRRRNCAYCCGPTIEGGPRRNGGR